MDLDFDRDDDEDDTQGILVKEPHQEHVHKANVLENDILDKVLDLDFDRVDVQQTRQGSPFHENDVSELDIEFDAHENHDDKPTLEPTLSVKFGDEEKALDEWGFDEAILLSVSKCLSEDSDQSSDTPCFESSQENESNYVHSQVPNFAPSNSKRISKPPCDRFVSFTTESMIDDDDDDDDDDDNDDDDDEDEDDDDD